MLTRIPHPRPTGGRAPIRVYPIYNHFKDHNGRATLSIWFDYRRQSLLPLFSFQVYVAYEATPAQNPERETLAKELYDAIMGMEDRCYKRLDIHFLRAGETTTDCVAAFRTQKRATNTILGKTIFPTCTYSSYRVHNSFLYILSDQDWKEAGLKRVFFDTPPRASGDRFFESNLVGFEIEEIAGELFSSWKLREEYMELFSEGKDAGMTEWQQVFDAAERLGMMLV